MDLERFQDMESSEKEELIMRKALVYSKKYDTRMVVAYTSDKELMNYIHQFNGIVLQWNYEES